MSAASANPLEASIARLRAATAVYVTDGSDFDSTGDEYRSWGIYEGDDDGEPVEGGLEEWGYPTRGAAIDAAYRIAGGREVVDS